MYAYNDFIWFVCERENIRIKKDVGLPRPWTSDYVLNNCRFTNIDRFHDRGSLLLIDFVKGMADWERIFYIILYRSCYSSPKFLKQMTGDWQNDYRNISTIKMKLVGSRIPYQIFLNKEQTISHFLFSTAFRVAVDFSKLFSSLEDSSLLYASSIIASLYKIYHGKRFIFLATEIAKDLSYFYPGRINPDSECRMNIGAMNALKRFPGRKLNIKIDELLASSCLNFSDLEHGLCEFNKWCEREEYYQLNGYFKKSWLY